MAVWSVNVSINSADISARLTGKISVTAEESTARIARFTFKPGTGVIDITSLIGVSVVIDYIQNPQTVPVTYRLFTGVVNVPSYDPVSHLITCDCTDNLQGHFEAKTEAQILGAITGGKYAIAVFGEREDGWQQALDILSTVPKAYDLNRDGITPALTDWAAAGIADFILTSADILDQSVALELLPLRDLINRITLQYQYRFTRLHHRQHGFGWNWGNTFCDYLALSHELPNRDMVQSAASDAGWLMQGGIVFETLPETGMYDCGGGPVGWTISDELLDQLVINATWTMVRHWTQTITETYPITVEDASSVALYGESLAEDGVGHQQDYDDAQWDQSIDASTPVWPINAIGDYTDDQLDRADSDNTFETLLQLSATRILAAHRKNYLSASTPIMAYLERSHTLSISDGVISGLGKVHHYNHELDTLSGSAITHVVLAISRSGIGGSSSALTAALPPDTEPTHVAPDSSTVLPTRIGNDDTAPNYDANWTGFTGNYSIPQGSPTPDQIYPRRMRVITPDIESESRDATEFSSAALSYNVQCPNEVLVING